VVGVTPGHGGTDRTDDLLCGVAVMAGDVVHQTRLRESEPAKKKARSAVELFRRRDDDDGGDDDDDDDDDADGRDKSIFINPCSSSSYI